MISQKKDATTSRVRKNKMLNVTGGEEDDDSISVTNSDDAVRDKKT